MVQYKLTRAKEGVRVSEHDVLNTGIKPTAALSCDEQV